MKIFKSYLKHRSIGVTEKKMKNRASKSVVQISATPINICNLSTSKMGKTWHFVFLYSRHTKTNFLAIERTQK
jgi:hypothetical protein